MGTLSFSKIASAILASVSKGGTLHTAASTGTFLSISSEADDKNPKDSANLSEITLKGKLDLSLWRDIGNDDEEEEEEEDVELLGRNRGLGVSSGATPPPAPSPILAPLLGTKSQKEKEAGSGSIKQTFSPVMPLSPTNTHSLGVLLPAVVISPHNHNPPGPENNNGFVVRAPSPTPLASSHYGNKASQYKGVTPPSSNTLYRSDDAGADGSTTRQQGNSQQREGFSGDGAAGLSLLRQQKPLLLATSTTTTTGSSITREQESGKTVRGGVEPKLLPFLSAFIGSNQLSRGAQYRDGQGGESKSRLRSARKVEFTTEEERKIMAEQQEKAAAAATMAGTSQEQATTGAEKVKRSESAKEGSAPSRSRSGSAVPINRRPSSRTVPTDILQEIRKMSLASQDLLEEKKKAGDGSVPTSGRKYGKKKHKRRKPEEVFTDKDRAAAVTLGSKDIKQSLKAKKKRDRKMRLSISFMSGEDYVIGTLLGEAAYQMRVKNQPQAALNTLNKALEIQPNHKGALVARSQCYLKLGDAKSALKDAELTWDPNNQNDRYIQGLFQYAEALYQLGEFEKALIAFHRGHRIRKDQDGFRIGIQKCQEAIKRAIGDKSATTIPNLDSVLPLIQEFDETKARLAPDERQEKNDEKMLKNIIKYKDEFRVSSPQDAKSKGRLITRELMGQLYLDKAYLKKFVTRPEVINQQGLAKGLRDEASEALNYLESRERFWRQQTPLYSRKNFTAMLKAHEREVACRQQSVITEPSVAKYLQRRSSVLVANASPPPTALTMGQVKLKRRCSSEQQLNQHQSRKSEDRETGSSRTTEDRQNTDKGKCDIERGKQSLKKHGSVDSVKSTRNNRLDKTE